MVCPIYSRLCDVLSRVVLILNRYHRAHGCGRRKKNSVMYLVIVLIGIAAGVISGIVGTGSSIMLLPALIYAFGPKAAIPIMAIAAIIGNVSRVILWRKDIDLKAMLLYSVPGVPAAVLGA